LRQLLRDLGRFSLVDIAPIASEARASNLQACGGCDMLLARRIGAELAITGTIIDSIDRNPAQLRNAIYQLARIKLRTEARRENPAMNPPEARRLTLALESASVGTKRSGKGSNGCKDGEQVQPALN